MFNDRRSAFKTPPSAIRDTSASQEQRRKKALEEQKRRRAERYDSSRQLDFFAELTLGPSDEDADEDGGAQDEPDIVRQGDAQFATMLSPLSGPFISTVPSESTVPHPQDSEMSTTGGKREKTKRKGKKNKTNKSGASAKSSKPNKWADKCMYAELLEMNVDYGDVPFVQDGIPEDIETGWVALTPVPVGKRCLAITQQASGIAGIVPNTTLRSRMVGKALMPPFPSPLPPHTILDCILDTNWQENGIVHVLDVLKWKGQDLTECETAFRFWWRDTRLSEIPTFPPPSNATEPAAEPQYRFPHPATFTPIPYHTDTTLTHLTNVLIPLTRSLRTISFPIPVTPSGGSTHGDMDLDGTSVAHRGVQVELQNVQAEVKSDGLLLYVAQATYEHGTSPLSNWVPLQAYSTEPDTHPIGSADTPASPLETFERLIRRRLLLRGAAIGAPEVDMES
ncbi:hypothetical protein CERSUDRAFT_113862 [Gelatoporia subvermispora B]|uniref:Snurportin-1 n=1 Tax=Ceriporiopsis subvermispora (strain B) TaxID=914234 RepID=M2R2B8_CERS8|nr:hypothetical protein CERSUDRAFT_113862 [Gelatoporia subvermispora B]